MRRARLLIPIAVLVAGFIHTQTWAGVRPHRAPNTTAARNSGAEIVPGTVIIKLRASSAQTTGSRLKPSGSLEARLSDAGAASVRQMFPSAHAARKSAPQDESVGLPRVFSVTLTPGLDPWTVAEELSALPEIEYAEPKYVHRLHDSPNDPLLANQASAFTRISAYGAWTLAKGNSSVVIADVDGGTDWRHEDLRGNVHVRPGEDANHNGVFDAADSNGVDDDGNGFIDDVVGWNFANDSGDPSGLSAVPQSYMHGTATASHCCAVTNNGVGMAGSSWNCSLMPVCAASPTSDNSIAYGYEGIAYAFQNGASIINCSWGRLGGFSQFEQDVITAALNAGVLIVAASGNDASNNDLVPHYPSDYNGVLAVGGTNSTDDMKASFSNYGKTVEVYAPSVNIFSAYAGGGYGSGGSGTSYASPLVAGLAGILMAAHPDWTPAQVAAQIRTTADPIDNVNYSYAGSLGRGRVNFLRALTETHPALDLVSGSLLTTRGKKLFIAGDTLVLSLRLRNAGLVSASGCQVTVLSSDSALQVLNGDASLGPLNPGEEAVVPEMRFRVGSLSGVREAVVRALWTYEGTAQDGAVFRAILFPSTPLWSLQLEGASASLFSVSAANANVVWAAGGNGSASSPVVLRSTNKGSTWEVVSASLQGYDFYCINAIDAQRAWVGSSDGHILATTDGGTSWSDQTYPGRQSPFINGIKMFSDGTGYAMGDPPGDGKFVVLKTTDFGSTWAHLASEPGLTSTEAGWNNSFWWTDQNHGWFGSNKSRIWRTTDGGTTWASAGSGGVNSYGVAFSDNEHGIAVHDYGFVARTTDGGATWSAVTLPTTDQMAAVTAVVGGQAAWVTDGEAPFHSRDNGATWITEALYPFSGSITHMSFADTTLGWAVTSNGEILCYDPVTLTGVPGVREIPASFVLEQNWPNPFNPRTTIGIRQQAVGSRWMKLAVYDLLGREVAVLVDEEKQPGAYTVTWDASGISSGVYICRMTAEGFVDSRKMLLLR